MKKYISLFICLFLTIIVSAQSNSKRKNTTKSSKDTSSLIFNSVEQMPEFEGGQNALMQYLSSNIKYPSKARENNIEGRVVVRFVVCTDGSLCNEEIVRSVDSSMDQEVIRVVKAMPNWKPAKQNGQLVKAYFTLPVSFKLQGQEKDSALPDAREYLTKKEEPAPVEEEEKIFTSVEHIAEFPGGTTALMKFLAENIKYPPAAIDKNITGRVITQFVVGKDGIIRNIVIKNDVPNSGFGQEAVRVINSMPKWNPGMQNGQRVSTYYTLPVTFKMDPVK